MLPIANDSQKRIELGPEPEGHNEYLESINKRLYLSVFSLSVSFSFKA